MRNQRSATQPLSLMDMAEAIGKDRRPVRWKKHGAEYVARHKHVGLHVIFVDDGDQRSWCWIVRNQAVLFGTGRARTKGEAQADAERLARAQL